MGTALSLIGRIKKIVIPFFLFIDIRINLNYKKSESLAESQSKPTNLIANFQVDIHLRT
jgi:hypothetical protein